jgi:predicted O-methyltransferase YrrM
MSPEWGATPAGANTGPNHQDAGGMDAVRFARELPELFDDFPRSERPRDRRFAPLLERIGGLARENNLALINLAASLLDRGESYVEVGSYKGLSLAAALDGNGVDVVGIDSFEMGDGSREQLDRNLGGFGYSILEGDAFELLPTLDRRVGAYYYDAAHDYESQLRGLELVEPQLAPGALMIVDDTDWERVDRAVADYLARQPRARRLVTIDGKDRGQPWWWEGMQVLVWDAAPG